MAVPFEAIRLKRGGRGYLIDGYIYIFSRERNGTEYLRCQLHKKGCAAAAKVRDLEAIVTNPVHDHALPDIDAIRFRAAVVQKAQEPANARLSVKDIYDAQS
jgi:hypothetical protein